MSKPSDPVCANDGQELDELVEDEATEQENLSPDDF